MTEHYYVDQDKGHDDILRCKDCSAIVTFETIRTTAGCQKCGNKRFNQINVLTEAEMEAIVNGEIDFPGREKFIAEFQGVPETA